MAARQNRMYKSTWNDWATNAVAVYVLVLTSIFPLFFDNTKYERLTYAKYSFFSAGTIIFFFLLLIRYVSALLWKECSIVQFRQQFRRFSISQIAVALLTMTMFVSLACSPYQEMVFKSGVRYGGIYTQILYVGVFFVAARFGEIRRFHLFGFTASVFVFSIIGLLQYAQINIFSLYPQGYNLQMSEFASTIGNIDFCSAYLCMAISCLATTFLSETSRLRFFILPPLVASLLLLLLLNVKSGILAMCTCVIILFPLLVSTFVRLRNTLLLLLTICLTWVLFLIFTEKMELRIVLIALTTSSIILILYCCLTNKVSIQRRSNHFFCYGISISVVVFICFLLYLFQIPSEHVDAPLYEYGQVLQGRAEDYFGNGRIGLWRRAWTMGKNRFLIGIGPNTFDSAFSEQFPQFIMETAGEKIYDAAHNEYLHMFCTYGILGVGFYLLALGSLIVRAYRRARVDKCTFILLSVVLSYSIQAIFNILFIAVAPVFILSAGMLEHRLAVLQPCSTAKH